MSDHPADMELEGREDLEDEEFYTLRPHSKGEDRSGCACPGGGEQPTYLICNDEDEEED